MRFRIFFILLCFVAMGAIFPRAESVRADQTPLPDVAVEYAGMEGGAVAAALLVTLPPGYHAYAHDDTGALPTRLELLDDRGEPLAFPVAYPPGVARQDALDPSRRVLVYEGRFSVWGTLPASAAREGSVRAKLSLLLCSARNCMPAHVETRLKAPSQPPALADVAWGDAYRAAMRQTEGSLSPVPSGQVAVRPAESSAASDSAPAVETAAKTAFDTFVPRFFQADLEPEALGSAVLFGLAAGLLLNFMPCVLPVLTIKFSGLLAVSGHEDQARRRMRLREHSLFFAAGVMTWFVGLALCVGGFGMAWGGLFQKIGVVYGLMIVVFLLALSMFDVFTLPVLDFKGVSSGNPKMRAYSAGLMATLLATPCGGPLLGGVLGWAVLQPLPVLFMVFAAAGLGMALPHLLLAGWPDAIRFLPRPGAWMLVMERIVGFFLMGTALYLLSILPGSLRLGALAVLLLAACAAWIWGRWGGLAAPPVQRALVGLAAVALVTGGAWWSLRPEPVAVWTPFSAQGFQAALGKEALLVEFTADWCPSCKVLERTVLTPERLDALADRYGLRLVRVDLTRPDPDGEALLRALGSVSIPVTAIFPRGFLAKSPLVLRDLYTIRQLEAALATLPPKER